MNLLPIALRLAISSLLAFAVAVGPPVHGQTVEQDRVVVAMTVQMLSFIENVESSPAADRVAIGVFEDESLLALLESLLESQAYAGKYRAVLIRSDSSLEEFQPLQALLFGDEKRDELSDTIRKTIDLPILLVGSFEGFLEQGGMVNIIRRQNRMTFEVDAGRAKRRGIEFRARLLRLANRVIE